MATYVPLQHPFYQPSDYLQTLGDVYALRGQQQAQQSNAQIMRDRDFEYQQKQQSWEDQQAFRQAQIKAAREVQQPPAATSGTLGDFHAGVGQQPQAAGYDPARYNEALIRNLHDTPWQIPGVIHQFTEQQKEHEALQKEQIENHLKNVQYIGQTAGAVNDQRSYDIWHGKMLAEGHVAKDELPAIWNPAHTTQLQIAGQTADQQITARQKQQDYQRQQAVDAQKAQHDADEKDHWDKQLDWQRKYQTGELGVRRGELGVQQGRLSLEKQKYGTDQDASVEQLAQQIVSGDVKAPALSRTNPYNRRVMQRVLEIDPQFSDSVYTTTQDLRSSKPNSMGANVQRLGTAMLHGDQALSESRGLGFSPALLTGLHSAETAAYRQSAEFLTGEVGQYVTGGKLTVDEGRKLSSDLMSSRQSVRDSALNQIITLSGGKLETQMQQYKNSTRRDFPTDRVFNDSTVRDSLQRHGVLRDSPAPSAGQTVRMKAPNGQTQDVPAAQVEHFKARGATVVK